jgi:hypothetical protein
VTYLQWLFEGEYPLGCPTDWLLLSWVATLFGVLFLGAYLQRRNRR